MADDIAFRHRYPEWSTLLACCLVQGGARHYVHHDRGVKDLDVYLFYAVPPGKSSNQFPWLRGGTTRNSDFGPSVLGRQVYTDAERADHRLARKVPVWESFTGRRVDLLGRGIVPNPDGPRAAVTEWLEQGARRRVPTATAWHLGRTPVVSLMPELGEVWWPGPDSDEAGIEKGLYDDSHE
ncbi:hypothetical protein [Rhodococcus wratislaviensis]|uniref:hypothetical protein n=1 Tax=Rhodococcus wratislaviensis TaxID=44752 RepID=UPI000F56F2C2|nr:hypothetical protein [Rhodococcus wratislaviensis]